MGLPEIAFVIYTAFYIYILICQDIATSKLIFHFYKSMHKFLYKWSSNHGIFAYMLNYWSNFVSFFLKILTFHSIKSNDFFVYCQLTLHFPRNVSPTSSKSPSADFWTPLGEPNMKIICRSLQLWPARERQTLALDFYSWLHLNGNY